MARSPETSVFRDAVVAQVSDVAEATGSPAGIDRVGQIDPVLPLLDRARAATRQPLAGDAGFATAVERALARMDRDLRALRRAVVAGRASARAAPAGRVQDDLYTLAGLTTPPGTPGP